MKRILLSLITVTLVVTAAIGVTRAYFSDVEKSQDNTLTAGAIDLAVDYNENYNGVNYKSWNLKDLTPMDRFFDHGDVKPGDYGEGTISLHVFNNNAYLYGQIIPKFDDDYSSTEPELETGDSVEDPMNGWDGELGRNMTWMIWVDNGPDGIPGTGEPEEGDNMWQSGEYIIAQGPASALGDKPTGWVYLGEVISSNNFYVAMAWDLPLGTGNEVQTDRYQADIAFLAVQQRHLSPGTLPPPVPAP